MRLKVLQGLFNFVHGGFLKAPQLDVSHVFRQLGPANALDLDDRTHDGEILGLNKTRSQDADRHLRAFGAAQLLHRLDQGHVLGRLALHEHDLIAGLDARSEGRRALDRGDDGQHVVANRNLDAQAAEASFRLDLHLTEHFRRHEGRMRIQTAQHAADGAVDDPLRLHFLHVIGLDVGEDFRENLQVFVALVLERVAIRHHHTRANAHQNDNDRP